MQKTIGILDTETGGFSTTKNGVCEIALLIVSEDLTEVVGEHTWLIKPYTRADDTEELVSYKDDAMAVHGIKLEELEEKGLEVRAVCSGFLSVLKDNNVRSLMGHNVNAFDIPKVEHLTTRFLGKDLKKYAKICTLKLSRAHLEAKDFKLETLCAEYKIEQKEAHRALSDCYSTLEIARILHEQNLLTS
ncbi:DNA polymerase III epsilon subunit [Flavobacterium sp. phage 1/32]|nr:DNA polymerase III epsilon subunit [Flavobacterium sp. phage 1/32]